MSSQFEANRKLSRATFCRWLKRQVYARHVEDPIRPVAGGVAARDRPEEALMQSYESRW
jgi:hypothetical protein